MADELNINLKSKETLTTEFSEPSKENFVPSCHEPYLYSESFFQTSTYFTSESLIKLLKEFPGFPSIFPPPSSTLFHSEKWLSTCA